MFRPLLRLCFGVTALLFMFPGLLSANNITICKSTGNSALIGQDFDFTVTGGTYSSGTISVKAGGACVTLRGVLQFPGAQSPFTITELAPFGSTLTGINVTTNTTTPPTTYTIHLTTRSVTINIIHGSLVTVTFTNSTGDQGCTPGFWKQSQHFDDWRSFSPNQTVSTIFSGAESSLESESLLDALQGGGGPGLLGAEKILLRDAVAALLNAANGTVQYPRTTAEIISSVDAALATHDRDTILALGTTLDGLNNGKGGCPLS